MSDKLEKRCTVCGSYTWCGRGCSNAPPRGHIDQRPKAELTERRSDPILHKRPPWEDDEPEAPTVRKKSGAKQKRPDTIRFPQEVKDYFQKEGPGWQKRINEVLLEYVRGRT